MTMSTTKSEYIIEYQHDFGGDHLWVIAGIRYQRRAAFRILDRLPKGVARIRLVKGDINDVVYSTEIAK